MTVALRIDEEGLALIKRFEGLVLAVYLDAAGLATIGWGHLLTEEDKALDRFPEGTRITMEEAEALLRADVAHVEAELTRLVHVPLSPRQWSTLCSFVFNVGSGALGASRLLRKLNASDYAAVPDELLKWVKVRNPKTKVLEPNAGLIKRRTAEGAMWRRG